VRVPRVFAQGRLLRLAPDEVARQVYRCPFAGHDVAADSALPTDEAEAVLRGQPALEVSGAESNALRSRYREDGVHVRGAALLRFPGAEEKRKAAAMLSLHRVPGSVVESLPPPRNIC
jgi:hypothetical protein